MAPRFVMGEQRGVVDLSVVVVTYNSAADVAGLVEGLRRQAEDLAVRVIVADNSSTDGTVELLRGHDDITVLPAGGNLGYSGGINLAMRMVPPGEPVLVLNPDLTVGDGALRALLDRMAKAGPGIVAPRIVGTDGSVARSLRRDPSTLRAVGDALFGFRFPSRPQWFSDEVADVSAYERPHQVDWASGAALLIHGDVRAEVGAWDERFFLYSEETDFQRRARDVGYGIWYEPRATVMHRQGGSGSSKELLALREVNRVRYVIKHHGRRAGARYRAAVVLHQTLRAWQPDRRYALKIVSRPRSWDELPKASGADLG